MSGKMKGLAGVAASLILAGAALGQSAVQPSVTYQGRLKFAGDPAIGTYDLTFTLWDAAGAGSPPTGGNQIGGVVSKPATAVSDGLFTVVLNELGEFGAGAFASDARWLQVAVNGTPLAPRHPITATPFALYALSGPGVSGLWEANGAAISNSNSGSVGIGDDNPLAFLHVGPEHLALGPADLHSEDVIIAGGDGVLGIYSDAAGGAGNGSAIALGEIGAGLTDKWGIFRDTNAAGSDLHISYGTDPDYAANSKFITFDAPTGNVGIGESAPIGKLHVGGDFRTTGRVALGNEGFFGPNTVAEKIFDFTQRITDFTSPAAFWMPWYSSIQLDPSVPVTKLVEGHFFETEIPSTNSQTFGFVGGASIQATQRSENGLIDTLRGALITAASRGDVTEQIGLAVNSDGFGPNTITDNRALDLRSGHRTAGGGIVDDYSLYINFPSRNSPLNSHYGIFLEDQGAAFPNTWAIYADGGQSYFKDAVGIGVTTPQVPLQVNGGTDAAPASGGCIVTGDVASLNIAIDQNEIMARNNGVVSDLFLNHNGGNLLIAGAGSGGHVGIGTSAPNASAKMTLIAGTSEHGIVSYASSSGVRAAVWAENLATSGDSYGVVGRNRSPAGFAVYGESIATTGTNYGVVGETASATGYGVYSLGRFAATGTKSFRIDHPTDPENKYLMHYCEEGPEALNSYSGVAPVDANGQAWVQLPDYFGEINKEPRILLTAVGAAMPNLHVAQKIVGNRFLIAGGVAGGEVTWEVKAVRNDLWMRAHGAPVEAEKSDQERGKFQHPELYGASTEQGITASPADEAR